MEPADYFPRPETRFKLSIIQIAIWTGFITLGAFLLMIGYPGLSILIVSIGGMTGYNVIAFLILKGSNILNAVLAGAGVAVPAILLLTGIIGSNGLILCVAAALISAGINGYVYRKHLGRIA